MCNKIEHIHSHDKANQRVYQSTQTNDETKNQSSSVDKESTIEKTDDEIIDAAAAKILKLYRSAFEKLAK